MHLTMKTIKFFSIIVLTALLLFADRGFASEWGFRGLLPRGTGYYDKSSIRTINDNIRQVWTVVLYNETGKADAWAILKKQDKAPENPNVLNQESTLLEFDCAKDKYRIVSINIYDENDVLLFSASIMHTHWLDMIPGSINEKLKNEVCRSGHQSENKKLTP